MTLARYRYFEKVARLGSIREAADALHVAPSAISRQIAYLEREYNVELFERQARGMLLTPAGHLVLKSARVLLDGISHARSELDDLQGLRRGHVRVWTVEGMVNDLVYPVLTSFNEAYPAVSFDVMIASSDQLVDRLLEDDADVAVIFDPRPNRNVASLAEISDPLVVICNPGHEAAKAKTLALADLGKWRLALPDMTFGMRHVIEETASAAKLQLQPFLETNSIEALRGFARSGMGVAILTGIATRQQQQLGQLVAIPLSDRRLKNAKVKVCVRRDRHLPTAAAEVARWLATRAKQSASGQPEALKSAKRKR